MELCLVFIDTLYFGEEEQEHTNLLIKVRFKSAQTSADNCFQWFVKWVAHFKNNFITFVFDYFIDLYNSLCFLSPPSFYISLPFYQSSLSPTSPFSHSCLFALYYDPWVLTKAVCVTTGLELSCGTCWASLQVHHWRQCFPLRIHHCPVIHKGGVWAHELLPNPQLTNHRLLSVQWRHPR